MRHCHRCTLHALLIPQLCCSSTPPLSCRAMLAGSCWDDNRHGEACYQVWVTWRIPKQKTKEVGRWEGAVQGSLRVG